MPLPQRWRQVWLLPGGTEKPLKSSIKPRKTPQIHNLVYLRTISLIGESIPQDQKNCAKLHIFFGQCIYITNGMADEDTSLHFDCPTCGSGPQEKCRSHSGADRCESHVERRDVAAAYCSEPKLTKPAAPEKLMSWGQRPGMDEWKSLESKTDPRAESFKL